MGNDQTCYLLDTSVILDDPANILRISDNNQNVVAITNIVLAEMNGKKDDMRSEAGFRAREFFRLADVSRGETVPLSDLPAGMAHCRQTGHCDNDKYYKLTLMFDRSLYSSEIEPVDLYIIFREFYRVADHFHGSKGLNDAKIGEIAKDYGLKLLTNDISFKIAAQVEQIEAESIRNASVERPDEIEFAHTYHYHETPNVPEEEEHRNFEQLTFIEESQSESHEIYETGRQRYAVTQNGQLEWCDFDRRFGEFFDDTLVRPINLEQKFYYTLLTHPQNYVTVVAGSTGSGKTLIALGSSTPATPSPLPTRRRSSASAKGTRSRSLATSCTPSTRRSTSPSSSRPSTPSSRRWSTPGTSTPPNGKTPPNSLWPSTISR